MKYGYIEVINGKTKNIKYEIMTNNLLIFTLFKIIYVLYYC